MVVIDPKRMEGGDVDGIALKIRDVTRYDTGNYTCELENEFGQGVSSNGITVDVHCKYYVVDRRPFCFTRFCSNEKNFHLCVFFRYANLVAPIVELVMEPDTPIIENNEVNVTLMCRVLSGNPPTLTRVTWFLDGGILKELPECNGDDGDNSLCGVDPDVLLLENVGRHFLGNYSCQGQNQAGVGNRSAENDLIVFYEPGNATLYHYPLIASKKKSITFFCSVDDGGNPNATRYSWSRGGSSLQYETSMVTFDNIGLDSRTNFSCYAYNEGGKGKSATIDLNVLAAPAFIQNLQPRTAALFSSNDISLSCRVECVPACTILWFKNNVGIEKNDERYYINETYVPADMAVGDFESVLSVLHFNMSAWPENKLDIYKDNANYSCVSSGNSEGPGVRSATVFHVECNDTLMWQEFNDRYIPFTIRNKILFADPPENTTVSNGTIDVVEGQPPPRVTCSGTAYPPLQYHWYRENNLTPIADTAALQLYTVINRFNATDYTCVSSNKHGNQTATLKMNILCTYRMR